MTAAPDALERARGGDRRAMEQLLTENAPLIWSVVRRFFGRAEPEDLFQLGSIGFVKAVRGFDPAFGTCFSTYAVPKIAGEMRRFLRDDGPVKVSRGIREQAARAAAAAEQFRLREGREPPRGAERPDRPVARGAGRLRRQRPAAALAGRAGGGGRGGRHAL